MGLTKVLTNLPYDFFKSQDVYFIRTKNTKLNEHLDFPLTPKTNEDGVRDFINGTENGITCIDKAGLED